MNGAKSTALVALGAALAAMVAATVALVPATAGGGGSPVKVTNTPLSVRQRGIWSVRPHAPAQPFTAEGTNVEQDSSFASDSFTVPAGKRLVLELVTGSIRVPSGVKADMGISLTPPSGNPKHFNLGATPLGDMGVFDEYSVTAPIRLYAGPGTQLLFVASRSDSGYVSFAWTFSGYLVKA